MSPDQLDARIRGVLETTQLEIGTETRMGPFPHTAGGILDEPAIRAAAELGTKRAQVELLRESLQRYGKHDSWCLAKTEAKRCTCGLRNALRIGAPA